MRRVRRDLDGQRLCRPGGAEVWLVFHGMRHYIASPTVWDALFCNIDITEVDEVDLVLRAPDLDEGSCLVRAGSGPIYLLTGRPPDTRKYEIADWGTFLSCGFNLERVCQVPHLLLSAITQAREIQVDRTRGTTVVTAEADCDLALDNTDTVVEEVAVSAAVRNTAVYEDDDA